MRNNIIRFCWPFCSIRLTPNVPSRLLGQGSELPAPYRRPTLPHSREPCSWAQPRVISPPSPPPHLLGTREPRGGRSSANRPGGRSHVWDYITSWRSTFCFTWQLMLCVALCIGKKVSLSINLHFHGGPDLSSWQLWREVKFEDRDWVTQVRACGTEIHKDPFSALK